MLVISIFKYEIHKSLPELPNGRQGHNRTQINLFPVFFEHVIGEDFEGYLNRLKFDQNLLNTGGF